VKVQPEALIFLALAFQALDRSVLFYQDILGMKEIKRVAVSDEKGARAVTPSRV